jgi:hypothetical protein
MKLKNSQTFHTLIRHNSFGMRHQKMPFRFLVFLVLSLTLKTHAQQAVVPTGSTVAFTCDFPGSDPSHYSVSVSSDALASYVSDGKLSRDAEAGEPFKIYFTMPSPTLTRIFDLAKKAHYFEGEIDSKKKNIASTGQKTLTYTHDQTIKGASYNYSQVPAIQELTTLFQNLSMTLEFGRRLEYDHRYQKLALDEELKQMNDTASRGELGDVAVIAPILKKIVDDPSVINSARARAERLLDQAGVASK